MKNLLFKVGEKSFYDDWTYRCEEWHPEHYSIYKIEGDTVWFNHPWHSDAGYWGVFGNPQSNELIRLYEMAAFGVFEKAFGLVE